MRLAATAVASFIVSAGAASATTFPSFADITVAAGSSFVAYSFPVLGDGSVRLSLDLVDCNGRVLEAVACDGSVVPSDWQLSIGLVGSIYPFIDGTVSFTDFGPPTALTVTFGIAIPPIEGLANTVIEGSITVPPGRADGTVVTSLPTGVFVEGIVFGSGSARAADVGDGSVDQFVSIANTENWGPIAGIFDCFVIGGCTVMAVEMGLVGNGNGEQYLLNGRFDIDTAVPAPIPLPAPFALLAGGLGLLGLAARRRRA